jgi:bacteriocin-like protein
LKGISEILSEKELKNVMGGSGIYSYCFTCSNGQEGTIKTNGGMDIVYDNFADNCPTGGFLYEC